MDFTNRIALVAGGASGIGAAVCARLRDAGAVVYCGDINGEHASADPRALALDVRDETAWTDAIGAIHAEHGRLDILVNCAGISAASPLADTSLADWRRVLETNLDGAFLATKHGIRAMRGTGGAIVHIGLRVGHPARRRRGRLLHEQGRPAHARHGRGQGVPRRGLGIRINLVSPAGVKTPMWRTMPFFQDLMRSEGSEEAAFAAMAGSGGGAFIEPDAVARVVCFLAGRDGKHVTGVELPVDDGYVL
jgi:NAD(P)-dependent dehydrogenase (short-subunit alcohol dehydrogenase family)